jgi:hypothetical protein
MAKVINIKDKQKKGKEQTLDVNEPKMGGKGSLGGGKGKK